MRPMVIMLLNFSESSASFAFCMHEEQARRHAYRTLLRLRRGPDCRIVRYTDATEHFYIADATYAYAAIGENGHLQALAAVFHPEYIHTVDAERASAVPDDNAIPFDG